MQAIEIIAFYDSPVHCLFCGQLVADPGKDEPLLAPCKHTIFAATDDGFEYQSPRASVEVGPDESGSIEDLIDDCDLTDAFMVSLLVGKPSALGLYVGFAPVEEL